MSTDISSTSKAIVVALADRSFGWKVDLIGAMLAAVRDAHADTITGYQREEINRALAHLAHASLGRGDHDPFRLVDDPKKIPSCANWHHYAATLKQPDTNTRPLGSVPAGVHLQAP